MTDKSKENVIRAYRKASGQSCAELALILGVRESTLRSYENGARRLTPDRAAEFERRTGGALTRVALLPELFGNLPQQAADPTSNAEAAALERITGAVLKAVHAVPDDRAKQLQTQVLAGLDEANAKVDAMIDALSPGRGA